MAGATKTLAAGDRLVQQGSEGKDVRARVALLPFDLLGRHVLEGAEDRPLGRDWLGRGSSVSVAKDTTGPAILASPKSSNFAHAACQHHVAGLEVAVDDALAVRGIKSPGNLDTNPKRLASISSAPLRSRASRLSPSRNSITRKSTEPSRPMS